MHRVNEILEKVDDIPTLKRKYTKHTAMELWNETLTEIISALDNMVEMESSTDNSGITAEALNVDETTDDSTELSNLPEVYGLSFLEQENHIHQMSQATAVPAPHRSLPQTF
ncbi:hypothetical protein DFQ28_000644, partial [Apophysomyces sp. BC1034]